MRALLAIALLIGVVGGIIAAGMAALTVAEVDVRQGRPADRRWYVRLAALTFLFFLGLSLVVGLGLPAVLAPR